MAKQALAIITGGSSGIGQEICRKLSEAGYHVINADVEKPKKEQKNVQHISCDITKASEVDKLAAEVGRYSGPGVLVLNAGRGIHQKLREGNPEEWAHILDLNLMGNLRVLRVMLPFMQQGHIIFTSSVSAETTYPWGGIYGASKAALETIAETLRLEEQPGIKVGVIRAGVVDTNFFNSMISGSQTVETIGWGAVSAEEIAEAVLFMLKQKDNTAVNAITIRPAPQSL